MISAKVIEHSRYCDSELITIQIKAPKFLDAELRTHRMFSQNSSSDRAIPFEKMVEADYFIPSDVRLNEKGMQGYTKVDDDKLVDFQKTLDNLRQIIIGALNRHSDIHKQHLNRYIIGYSYQDKIITGNREWFDYFIKLRKADNADPAIIELSKCVETAINESNPKIFSGYKEKWHLPYISVEDNNLTLEQKIKCSVARCARVSYMNHDGTKPNLEDDLKLYDFLEKHFHLSPFEHQATPMMSTVELGVTKGVTHKDSSGELWSGNFKEWIQYRQTVARMIL